MVSLVLLLLFGTVLDLGRAFYAMITVENAARAGALVAAGAPNSIQSVDCSSTNAKTNLIVCAVQNESRGSIVTVAASDIEATCENLASPPSEVGCLNSPQPGTRSRVTVHATFTLLTPIMQVLFGRITFNVSASVAADQASFPSPITALSSATPMPTPTPTPTATAAPTGTPQPTGTPVPCPAGQALVPDLVNGATGPGTPETLSEAQLEWQTAGFNLANFSSEQKPDHKYVAGQYTDKNETTVLTPAVCAPVSTTKVFVTDK